MLPNDQKRDKSQNGDRFQTLEKETGHENSSWRIRGKNITPGPELIRVLE